MILGVVLWYHAATAFNNFNPEELFYVEDKSEFTVACEQRGTAGAFVETDIMLYTGRKNAGVAEDCEAVYAGIHVTFTASGESQSRSVQVKDLCGSKDDNTPAGNAMDGFQDPEHQLTAVGTFEFFAEPGAKDDGDASIPCELGTYTVTSQEKPLTLLRSSNPMFLKMLGGAGMAGVGFLALFLGCCCCCFGGIVKLCCTNSEAGAREGEFALLESEA